MQTVLKYFLMGLLFVTQSIWALGPILPPIQWLPAVFPRDNAAGTWSWPLTSV